MEQQIGFCAVGRRKAAFATVGDGPPLLVPAWWFSHLELDWSHPGLRSFLTALAQHYTVVRYDRIGTGLSDRSPWSGPPTLDAEVDTLEAVAAAVGAADVAVFAMSCAGCIAARFAQRHGDRVRRIVFYGSYADGRALTDPAVSSVMLRAVRTHWGLGARVLTDVFLPDAPAGERRFFERAQRGSATGEVAADLLESVYASSARDELASLKAPALVLHRRGDQAVRFELGRRLAGLVPGARLLPLEGNVHVPWLGRSQPVLEATIGFLQRVDDAPSRAAATPGPANGSSAISAREQEVLRLVASGLTNDEIAETLVVSPHTVHRHVANIRAKLRQPTRAAAAVEATRRQLI